MEPATAQRAVAAARSTASAAGLVADEAVVLHDSNRLVLRLLPCDTVAKVSPVGWFSASREVEVVRRLVEETDAPVAGLDPRVEPRLHERDGFEIALWTYLETADSRSLSPAAYAHALDRLHAGLRVIDMDAPHFSDRLASVRRWLADPDVTPDLPEADRSLLSHRLADPRRSNGTAAEQLLHGEPHPWNVLVTAGGLRFTDFENCARGPVENDLAWVPAAVSDRRPDVDADLVAHCRGAVLALVAAHRWRSDDHHPSGRRSGEAFLDVVRAGPPWPALVDVQW